MCLAIPGKIVSIDESDPEMKMAQVKFGEIVREICIQWIDNPAVGEYIIAHVGTALNKVDEEDARATLDLLHEMGEIDYDSNT
jgi:hydrogenase expression/formation protein HypC